MSGPGLRQPPAGYMLGVDVGSPQGLGVDWPALAAAGCAFAVLRICWGVGRIDPTFIRNVRGCASASIPWGVYAGHTADRMGQPTAEADGRAEAQHLLQLLDGRRPALGAWCDWEIGGGSPLDHYRAVRAWCETVEAAGLGAGIYTGPSFVAQMDRLDGPGMRPELQALASRPLWCAHYTGSFERPPRCPAPWTRVTIWQGSGNHYTRDAAGRRVLCSPNYSTIPGTSTEIDVNLFAGTLPELLALGAAQSPAQRAP